MKELIEVLRSAVSGLRETGTLVDEEGEFTNQIEEAADALERLAFGKHKGELLTAIPSQYRDWLLRQSDVDPYLLKALA